MTTRKAIDMAKAGTFLALAAFSSERSSTTWHDLVIARLRDTRTDQAGELLARPIADLLRGVAANAVDLGARGALIEQALEHQGTPDDLADQLGLILYAIAEHGARAHALTVEAEGLLSEEATR